MRKPMKRHPAFLSLSREHHDGLVIAQVLKSDVPAYKGMPERPVDRLEFFKAKFQTALKPHFNLEEEKLFPLLRSKDPAIDSLIEQLLLEHRQLEAATTIHGDDSALETLLDATGRLLERHIRSEERELFQWAQTNLNEEELKELAAALSRN